MSLIITFMLEPAKLQMNCASASGAMNARGDPTQLALAIPLSAAAALTPLRASLRAASSGRSRPGVARRGRIESQRGRPFRRVPEVDRPPADHRTLARRDSTRLEICAQHPATAFDAIGRVIESLK